MIEVINLQKSFGDNKVLDGIDMNIEKGEIVVVIGPSGSGKSTFVDLLPRFYDVNSGKICIDGIDIRELSFYNLREFMGNVNQDPILFNDTIYNNIAFGIENATLEQVEQAARIANAHEFILQTEHGYQTIIGDRGGKLSGGQRQRLSIARAVLKNPPIMILDEATANIDTETEQLIQQSLERMKNIGTMLVVAHRLSTIRNADVIFYISKGEILERGSHEELILKKGKYFELYTTQETRLRLQNQ